MMRTLTSKRPYFLKCWYDWMKDNGLTPYIIVDAEYQAVHVPKDYVENNRIILNIAPAAVHEFNLTHEKITFKADFGPPVGIYAINIPVHAVVAIYAEENKQGAFFKAEETESTKDNSGASPVFSVVEE